MRGRLVNWLPRLAMDYGITPPMLDDMTFDEIKAFESHIEQRDKAAKRADAKRRAKGRR